MPMPLPIPLAVVARDNTDVLLLFGACLFMYKLMFGIPNPDTSANPIGAKSTSGTW